MTPRSLLAAVAFVALPCVAAAQVEPGGRVRLGLQKDNPFGRERLVGVVAAVEPDGLAVQVKGQRAVFVPYDDILRIEASRGRSVWRGMGRGALIGAGVGALAGLAQGDDPPGTVAFSAGAYAIMFGILGAPVGGVIGAVIGRERWETVDPARVRLGVLPVRGGAGISVSVAFSGRRTR